MSEVAKAKNHNLRVLVTGLTNNPGGVETVVLNFVRHLQSRIEFDFWVNTEVVAFQEELAALGCGVFHGVRYSRHPLTAHREFAAFVGERAGMYDVLWSNKSMCANVDDLVSAKRAGIARRIIHAHNSRDMFPGALGTVKSVEHRRNRARLGTLATDFWACSSGAAEYFFLRPELASVRFRFIRNAVDPSQFEFDSTTRARLRAELGITESCPVVGFVGRLQYQKFPELAIRVFREFRTLHPSAVLVMIGDGDLRSSCESEAVSLGNSVRFLGIRQDIAAWYSALDVLLMPSRFEGLPLVPVEAQAAALPVVASDGVPREVAFTDLVTFVPVGAEPVAWTRALAAALSTATARGPMTAAVSASGYDISSESTRVGGLLGGAG